MVAEAAERGLIKRDMDKDKHLNHKPSPMLLRVLLLGMAVLMSKTVVAENSFLMDPNLDDLKDGSVMLAPIGRRGAGIRMLFQTAGHDSTPFFKMINNGMWQINEGTSEAFISVVIPW